LTLKKPFTVCLLFFLQVVAYGFCDSLPPDTTSKERRDFVEPISVQDTSVIVQDTTSFNRIKQKFSKRRWTRLLYDAIVREPKSLENRDDYSTERAYLPFQERKIENIEIITLCPFGTSVYEPDVMDSSWIVLSANKMYLKTRENLIRKNLFFNKGDKIDPLVFAETEAYLRSIGFVHDVRIVVDTINMEDDMAKVTVIVRDRFPTAFGINSVDAHSADFEVYNKNLARTGSELYLRGIYDYNYTRQWGYGVDGRYNNIAKTFINTQAKYLDRITSKDIYAAIERPLRTTLQNYGLISYEQETRQLEVVPWDSISPPHYYAFSSALGHAFRLGTSEKSLFFSVAGGYLNYRSSFSAVEMLPNPLQYQYVPRHTFLMQFNLYHQRYYRQCMINSFGVMENIAHGFLLSGQAGYDMLSGFYNVPYFSLAGAIGKQFSFANINFNTSFGAHVVDRQLHNGIINAGTSIFSPLLPLGNARFRQFLNVKYATYLNSHNAFGFIDSNLPGKLQPSSLDDVQGSQRLGFNTESNFFTSVRLIGFRMVVFVFFEGEWISDKRTTPVFENFNWASGVGIRLCNDLLVFNTIVLTVGFYPSAQHIGDFFGGFTSDLRQTPNFLPKLPQVILID
jgi:hypothetical protein